MAYKVQSPDGAWHSTDDLTGVELEAISASTGVGWAFLNPYADIAVYRAMVAAFAIRTGMGDAEVVAWFGQRSARELGDGVSVASDDDDDLPGSFEDGLPKATTDEPTTGSSATSPDHLSGGPLT